MQVLHSVATLIVECGEKVTVKIEQSSLVYLHRIFHHQMSLSGIESLYSVLNREKQLRADTSL